MISQNRYISIISGVGAGASVAGRKLIMRAITQNVALPPGIVIEFSSTNAVGSYFGFQSEEYLRCLPYLGFISKSITSPSAISFARWVSTPIAPMVVGDSFPKTLASFAGVTTGLLQLNVGLNSVQVTAIDLSSAADMTAVASAIQVAIRKSTDPQLVTATVTFNTNTNQFVLTGAVPGSGSITVTPTGQAGDISQLLGWGTANTVLVGGQAADTPDVAIAKSASVSNNFGSFIFTTGSTTLTNAQIALTAQWNAAQNNSYLYSVATPIANAGTLFGLVKGYSGFALNILSTTNLNDYVEQSPCEVLASIDYNQPGAVQNYMFYQFPSRNVTVSDDTTANQIDAIRANYIGVTQSAGQQIAFYQRGVLCGGPTDATDMGVYGNEMWLKSAINAAILTLLLASPDIPASPTGASQVLGVIQPILTLAGDNGTFAPGKPLTAVQQQFISTTSGDRNAWRQVLTLGYWITVTFSSYVNTNSGLTEWKASYKLIYSKGDSIRFVDGSDIMI